MAKKISIERDTLVHKNRTIYSLPDMDGRTLNVCEITERDGKITRVQVAKMTPWEWEQFKKMNQKLCRK